jgi:crotonobetainyl-CoA:carnitine CoA-transferase CaiB-like acyl-CoA transferase
MTMLEGVRVLELGTTITAPLAAMLLADLGADVIKIERPEGDPFRSFRGGKYSPHFIAFNRNKRSVVLDLTQPSERHKLHELLATADVLIDNVRPNVLPRVGLEPALLRERFPRLIHCSITGFGASGPYRDRPAFDAVAQALSGMSSLFLNPENPDVTGPTISDNVTGMYAAYGILGALFERQRTGAGRRLEVNMLEASMAFIPDAFANVQQLGLAIDTHTRVASSQSYAFRCGDGKLVAIHMSSIEKFWLGLVDVLEAPELRTDPRFTGRMDRLDNYLTLRALLAERFAMRPRAEWIGRLEAADVPYAAVNSITEVLDDPQIAALGTRYTTTHPTEGTIAALHSPLHVDGTRITPQRPPPTLGEHTAELLP